MALVINDRVRETTTVTGTNDATLLGAVTGFQAFSVIGNGNTTYYTISDQSGGNWEVGIGTYSSVGPTLARTTILSSSNSGSIVSFPAGTKDVFVTYPSEKAVYLDGSDNVQPALGNVVASQVNITAQGDLRLEDTSGGQYVALQAPGTVATSYTLTLPVDDGTNGQALITDGSGNLSWSSAASGDVYGPASATDDAIARFDGTTGKIIQNSLVTISDTTGSLNFTATGARITGDFSSAGASVANAVAFQSSTIDGTTSVSIIPNGTSVTSAIRVFNNSNPTNAAFGQIVTAGGSEIRFVSSITGTGTYIPITMYTGGSERLRIDTSGNVGIGTTSPQAKLSVSNSGAAGLEFFVNYPGGGLGTYIQSFSRSGGVYVDTAYDAATHSFRISGTERMRIDSAGNVGIGTSSPAAKFVVSNAGAGGVEILPAGTIQSYNRSTSAYQTMNLDASVFLFRPSGTEAMRLDSAGNLGIGTSSPVAQLDIYNAVNGYGGIGLQGYSTATKWYLSSGISGVNVNTFSISNSVAGNSSSLAITGTGNVGIGTDSPAAPFEVSRAFADSAIEEVARFSRIGASPSSSNRAAAIVFKDANNATLTAAVSGIRQNSNSDFNGALGFYTNNTGGSAATTVSQLTERMRIDSSGNVGIGTSSPAVRLHTQGGRVQFDGINNFVVQINNSSTANGPFLGSTGADVFTINTSGGAERMRIDSSGNVGIGTSSPAGVGGLLSVVANGNTGVGYLRNLATSGITSDQLQVAVSQSTSLTSFYLSRFYTNVISSPTVVYSVRGDGEGYFAGNVGIGTTDTSGIKLNVNAGSASLNTNFNSTNASGVYVRFQNSSTSIGDIGAGGSVISGGTAGDFAMASRSGNLVLGTGSAERMRIDSSGNVGIGTSSPAYRLDISGNTDAPFAARVVNLSSGASAYSYLRMGNNNDSDAGLLRNSSGNTSAYAGANSLNIYQFGAFPIGFVTNNAERMRITSAGVLLVNSTTSVSGDDNNKAQVTGAPTSGGVGVLSAYNSASSGADASPCLTLYKKMTTTSSSARFVQFYANDATQPMGGIVGNGAENVQFLTLSDEREKENIKPVEGALNRIMQLQVSSFNRKGSKEFVPSGFIAQNVLPVYPEYVVENAANDDKEQRYGITGGMSAGYIAELTAAIQEQQAMIENLTTRLNALEGK